MAMSDEQVNAMVAGFQSTMLTALREMMDDSKKDATENAAKATTEGANGNSDNPRKKESPKLDPRNFMEMDKFGGGETAWKDWTFDFKVMFNSISPSMKTCLKQCEPIKDN